MVDNASNAQARTDRAMAQLSQGNVDAAEETFYEAIDAYSRAVASGEQSFNAAAVRGVGEQLVKLYEQVNGVSMDDIHYYFEEGQDAENTPAGIAEIIADADVAPEKALSQLGRLAMAYRPFFDYDVEPDVFCFRDSPSYTNSLLDHAGKVVDWYCMVQDLTGAEGPLSPEEACRLNLDIAERRVARGEDLYERSLLSAKDKLGRVLYAQGAREEADRLLQESLDGLQANCEAYGGESYVTLALCLGSRFYAYRDGGDLERAEAALRAELDAYRRYFEDPAGPSFIRAFNHVMFSRSCGKLAAWLLERGERVEAEALVQEGREALEAGKSLDVVGEVDKLSQIFGQARELLESVLSPDEESAS